MAFRVILISCGFLLACSSYYFLIEGVLISGPSILSRFSLAVAIGVGCIALVRSGVENCRPSLRRTVGFILFLVGGVGFVDSLEASLRFDAHNLTDLVTSATVTLIGSILFAWGRRRSRSADNDSEREGERAELIAQAWIRFVPPLVLALAISSMGLMSILTFVVSQASERMIGMLVITIITLIFGALVATGNRFSSLILAKSFLLYCLWCAFGENDLRPMPWRLLLGYCLLRNFFALRTFRSTSGVLLRPTAGWAWRRAIAYVTVLLLLVGLGRLVDYIIMAKRLSAEYSAILVGQPHNLEELSENYEQGELAENAANVLNGPVRRFLVPKFDPTRTLGSGNTNTSELLRNWSFDTSNRVTTFLTENTKEMAALHSGARMSQCRFDLELRKGFAMLLRHVAGLKKAAQAMQFEAVWHIRNGDEDSAVLSMVDMLKLANTLNSEPVLVSQLNRLSMQEVACSTLEDVLHFSALGDAQLRSLLESFKAAEAPSALGPALLAERCVGDHVFSGSISDFTELLPSEEPKKAAETAAGFRLMKLIGRFDRDHVNYLKMIRLLISLNELPFPERLRAAAAWGAEVQEGKIIHNIFTVNAISGMLLPALERAIRVHAHNLAQLRCAEVALALERFRNANGEFPLELRTLSSYGLDTIPNDPFDGHAIRYKRLPDGYVVYSVGPDGRDNGGKAPPPNAKPHQLNLVSDLPFVVRRKTPDH